MKRTSSIISALMVVCLLILDGCGSSTTVINGNWVPSVDYGGPVRQGAYQFTIGQKAYIGLGYGGKNGNEYLLDSYSYDLTNGYWTQIADFPGKGRELMVAFELNGKGYVGTGYNRNEQVLNDQTYGDFWQYDPDTNTWTSIAPFPIPRYAAVAFTTPEGAFVGTGYDGNWYNDFYRYDDTNDEWLQVASIPRKKRFAMSMNVTGRVFVFGGDSGGTINTDFYEYDAGANTWTSRTQPTTNSNYADFAAAIKRSSACSFTLDDFAYVVAGSINGVSPTQLCYQYNPVNDTWTKMTSFEGASRQWANSFVLTNETGQHAFMGMGGSGTLHLGDFWEWKPLETYDAVN